jgi:hypothetical protein
MWIMYRSSLLGSDDSPQYNASLVPFFNCSRWSVLYKKSKSDPGTKKSTIFDREKQVHIDLFGEEDHKEMVIADDNYRLLRRRRAEVARRAEEADYWRKRAGWFDDDASMKDYNNGVYDAYYQLDDDGSGTKKNSSSSVDGGDNAEMVKLGLKVGSVVAALGLCILMYRAITRRMSGEKKSGKEKSRSTSRTRERRSASRDKRSASRSRKGEDDYNLMDNEDDEKSRKSSRSKSKGRSRSKGRSASRNRSRSRSKARTGNKTPALEPKEIPEPVLV